jgi:hypothetical protein
VCALVGLEQHSLPAINSVVVLGSRDTTQRFVLRWLFLCDATLWPYSISPIDYFVVCWRLAAFLLVEDWWQTQQIQQFQSALVPNEQLLVQSLLIIDGQTGRYVLPKCQFEINL